MSGPDERDQRTEIRDPLEPTTEFECELTKAMRRVEAPGGFAERVMMQAEKPGSAKIVAMKAQWRTWASGAIAALIVLGALQGERVHRQHERQEWAQEQFNAAQRITDQTLTHVREQVRQAISMQE